MPANNKNREKLIECAKKEFLEKGFAKAALRNICSQAGLTTGAVYFLFKDKPVCSRQSYPAHCGN